MPEACLSLPGCKWGQDPQVTLWLPFDLSLFPRTLSTSLSIIGLSLPSLATLPAKVFPSPRLYFSPSAGEPTQPLQGPSRPGPALRRPHPGSPRP